MGESLDNGHVLAVSLWDDVEVNMLWLDSAYPLDKDIDQPGVKRGECPGGESSTPTYVRNKYPKGYVRFQHAYVGPIGSYLSNLPAPSPSPTPGPGGGCGCGPQAGKNQPECVGQKEDRCKQMSQNENKCMWKDCPAPTPSPTPAPTPAPTPVPVTTTTTTTPQVGECKSFCAQSLDDWSFKCSWHCCAGCPECTATTTTTTTAAPKPSTCKKICAERAKTKPWSKLCKKNNCRGCAECEPPKRRLAVKTQHQSDSFFV